MIFPYAPSYRGPIYQLMDKEFDVDWYFCGNVKPELKLLDYQLLKNCNLTLSESKVIGPITRYKGVNGIDFDKYDIVIIAGVIRNISEWTIPVTIKRYTKTKIYCWTHGWYGKETPIQSWIKRKFFNLFDGMLVYGDYAKNLLINQGYPAHKIHVIKNSLDYENQLIIRNQLSVSDIYSSHFNNDYPTLIFLGRLTPVKRLDMILKAIYNLNQMGEYFNFVLVGDGSEKEKLIELTKELNLNDRVWFVGECFDEKLNAIYLYNADLCVAPGNIGLTAIHSLMFGCPALTHNDFKWQMPEFESIKPDKTGTFFKRDDIESLASEISRWFSVHRDDRREIRKNCFEEIDNCWNTTYQLFVLKDIIYIYNA